MLNMKLVFFTRGRSKKTKGKEENKFNSQKNQTLQKTIIIIFLFCSALQWFLK